MTLMPAFFQESAIKISGKNAKRKNVATRQYLGSVNIERSSQEEIKSALDRLENKLGPLFALKFKSITFDNGVEFLDWQSLELSLLHPTKRRTTVYFAHAYSAWERGSNEHQNKMIRRFIPKGTDIHDVNEQDIKKIQNWLNNYPRKQISQSNGSRKLSN